MKVLFVGMYNRAYTRTWYLENALKAAGIEVEHCCIAKQKRKSTAPWLALWRCVRQKRDAYDAILVPYPGDVYVPFVRLISRKPIIYDAWISLYDTMVFDHKKAGGFGFRSKYFYWLRDKLALSFSHAVITESQEYCSYFVEKFRLSPEKVFHIRCGANLDVFTPSKQYPDPAHIDPFIVSFHGKIVSDLAGIEHILDAAKILEKHHVVIRFIGSGRRDWKYKKMASDRGITNVEFLGWVPFQDLSSVLSQSHVCLSALGVTPKADKIISTKLWEAAALRRALIVGDTPPRHDLFRDGENCLFVRLGDGRDLAEKILLLKQDAVLRKKIADGARNLYDGPLALERVGADLKKVLDYVLVRT